MRILSALTNEINGRSASSSLCLWCCRCCWLFVLSSEDERSEFRIIRLQLTKSFQLPVLPVSPTHSKWFILLLYQYTLPHSINCCLSFLLLLLLESCAVVVRGEYKKEKEIDSSSPRFGSRKHSPCWLFCVALRCGAFRQYKPSIQIFVTNSDSDRTRRMDHEKWSERSPNRVRIRTRPPTIWFCGLAGTDQHLITLGK